MTFSLTLAEMQAWISSIGVFLTGVIATAGFVQSLRNGRTLRRGHGETQGDVSRLSENIIRVEFGLNGMKKELQEKAFEDGVRAAQKAAELVVTTAPKVPK